MANDILILNDTDIIFGFAAEHAPGATAANNLGADTADGLDLGGLVAGTYRQSDKADFLSPRAKLWEVTAAIEPLSAPTAGGTVEFWAGWSGSSTAGQDNPAGLSGADAAYNGYDAASADADEAIHLLDWIGAMIFAADPDVHVGHVGFVLPRRQYGIVVVRNNLSVNLAADAVEMSVRFSPVKDQVQ